MGYKKFREDFDGEIRFARECRKKLAAMRESKAATADEILFGYFDLLCVTLAEINGNVDSLAMSYTKMLKIQEARDAATSKKKEAKES